ncbi:MAG TPA: tetratricopeptide repeat protein [Kamptonema sp.]|nr:tetratricopeptide repeat protein [Kamptonema sp.]
MNKMSNFETGIAAFESGNYAEALQILLPLAELGNPEAQFSVGCMYDPIFGIQADTTKAISWYRQAAEQDHPIAQNNLATLYLNDKNVAEAIKWYHKAAELGFPFAQEILGDIYSLGLGMDRSDAEVIKDELAAIKWYTKAAVQGFPTAKRRLAEMAELQKLI